MQSTIGRPKYRDPAFIDFTEQNMMWDRRIVRGNTYAAQIPTSNQQEQARVQRIQDVAIAKRMQQEDIERRLEAEKALEDSLRAVAGRQHMDVQTDDYLEDLDDAVFEQEMGTQTDLVEEVAAPEIYPHPYKEKGESKSTEIKGKELFDFDIAVLPILQTLMGKSMDYGLTEVLQEQELKMLRKTQGDLTKEKQNKEAEIRDLEAKAKKDFEDKERHINEERARLVKEHEVARKIASNHKARQFLADLQNDVLEDLQGSGFFFDPQQHAVREKFLPWVMAEVTDRLALLQQSQTEVDNVIYSSLKAIRKERSDLVEAKEAARRAKKEEAERLIREAREAAEEAARKVKEIEEERLRKLAEEEAAKGGEGDEGDDGGEGDEA